MGVASTSADSFSASCAHPAAVHSRLAGIASVRIRETMRLLMTAPCGFGPLVRPVRAPLDRHGAVRGGCSQGAGERP